MVQRRVLRGHKNWVYAVEWSPDGRLLASCSTDHTLRVWRSFDAGDANAEDVDETDARAAEGMGGTERGEVERDRRDEGQAAKGSADDARNKRQFITDGMPRGCSRAGRSRNIYQG